MDEIRGEDPIALGAYNACAEVYADVAESTPFRLHYERPALLSLLPEVRGQRVLDAGCGTGWLCEHLASQGADVTGVDATPRMVAMARQRLGSTARVVEADLGAPLDFIASSSLDLVVSSLTLHYVRDWTALFDEINRVLTDGGRLVFSVCHPFNPQAFEKRAEYFAVESIVMRWSAAFDPPLDVPMYRRSLTQILQPLNHAGFLIEHVVEPEPTEDCRRADRETCERLRGCPLFLCVGAIKHRQAGQPKG